MFSLAQQLTFEFAHNGHKYNDDDLVISSSNLAAHRLIALWPHWSVPIAAIIGEKGSGKTHFASVWKKNSKAHSFSPNKLFDASLAIVDGVNVLVEDLTPSNFKEHELFHLLNSVNQARSSNPNVSLLITSQTRLSLWSLKLPDLASRLKTIIEIYIEQPDDMLLRAVLCKLFSDKQIIIDNNVLNYIISRMERSLNFAIKLVNNCDKEALKKHSKVNKQIVNIALDNLLNV